MERHTRRSVGSVRFGRVLLQRVGGMEPLSLSPLLRYQFHFFVPPSLLLFLYSLGPLEKKRGREEGPILVAIRKGFPSSLFFFFFFFFALPSFFILQKRKRKI